MLGAQGGQGIIGGSSGAVKMGRPNKGVSFGTAAGSGSTVNEKDAGLGASSGSSTALVDATIEFLREFIDGSKKKSRNNRRSNGVSIAGPSGRGNKGKERMSAEEMGDDGDDLAGESFLPTHVYEAMREKKRFDSMKASDNLVSPYSFFRILIASTIAHCHCVINSSVNKKTRKSSSVSTSIHWKRSSSQF